ncbi:terminase small subunit [Lactobacillus sp. ESL0701]|uniref:terminase small subunit n=1 Tax=Lactobacillus sp. ESL0701 TaxID=2983217 RepID=UPI0032AF0C59
MSLTVKQQKFANEYIKSGNATEAAIKAGYSKRTAYSIGQENLKKVEIANYLEKRMKEISDSRVAG